MGFKRSSNIDEALALNADASTQAEHLQQIRREHASEVAEDYVEAIADLIRDKGEARVVDLAAVMGVTHVTVNRTIGRLQSAGLVTSKPYRSIFLTEEGEALARFCKDRHLLVVTFLRAIGVEQSVAEKDAEGMEHHVSPETLKVFKKWIAELQDRPAT